VRTLFRITTAALALFSASGASAGTISLTSSSGMMLDFALIGTQGSVNQQVLAKQVPFAPTGSANLTANILTVDAAFTLSSQATPLVFSGTIGPSAVPVTLELDSLSFQVPLPVQNEPPLQLPYGQSGDPTLSGGSASYLIPVSGSLTVGGTNVSFVFDANPATIKTNCAASIPNFCWSTNIQFLTSASSLRITNLDTISPLGGFTLPLGTISGVDFSLTGFGITADQITFGTVPEPSTLSLCALSLLVLGATGRSRYRL